MILQVSVMTKLVPSPDWARDEAALGGQPSRRPHESSPGDTVFLSAGSGATRAGAPPPPCGGG